MKTSTWARGLATLAVCALAVTGPAGVGQKQSVEAVAYYLAFDFGEGSVTPSGNIHISNMAAVCMVTSDNPLFNGRLTWVGNFNGDAELNGAGSGTGILEVGTWDLSSGAPVFIPSPTGGLWVTRWEAKGSLAGLGYTGKVVGHGVAGEVEAMLDTAEFQGDGTADYYRAQILDPHAK